ncbi:MAG TPA: hypothetical protein VFG76_01945, partial [Candidatus Polarisedimenticolia bacterium]|nr:hypothetical protein [Candidatus Polarisedimenticolia bacterium]
MTRPSRRIAVCVVALAVVLPSGREAMAARLPDWAKQVAKDAPPVPEGLSPYRQRVLLSETRNAVQPDGSLQIRRRFAVQVLDSDPDPVSFGSFYVRPTMRVKSNRCWHVPPGKRGSVEDVVPVEITVTDDFLTDSTVRRIGIDGVVKGSVVLFEFEVVDVPYFVSLTHLFYEGAPVQVARFEVEVPTGWRAEPVWIRGGGAALVTGEGRMTWEMRDLPRREQEPLGPDPIEEAPLLGVHLIPPAGATLKTAIFSD